MKIQNPGADPIMGLYATTENVAFYANRLHPQSLGHALLVPDVVPVIEELAGLVDIVDAGLWGAPANDAGPLRDASGWD